MKITKWVNDKKVDVYISFEISDKRINIMFDSTDKSWLNPQEPNEKAIKLLEKHLDSLLWFLYKEEDFKKFMDGGTFGLQFREDLSSKIQI